MSTTHNLPHELNVINQNLSQSDDLKHGNKMCTNFVCNIFKLKGKKYEMNEFMTLE